MNVAVLCEFSGIVGNAFRDRGHDVISCDLLPTESLGLHIQGDVFDFLNRYNDNYFDLIIMHPPCRYLATSGNRWYAGTRKRREAILWTINLWILACKKGKRIAIENPVSVIWKYLPNVNYIHPWEHGHGETKKTGFCLHKLSKLKPSNIVLGREPRIHYMGSNIKNRSKERSRFLPGIAKAMSLQWG